jgi:RimJ/RimL family protein N-acetyltransferase
MQENVNSRNLATRWRAQADTLVKNKGARRLAEKFGFKLEGIRKKYVNMYSTLEDLALYALIL